MIPSAVGVLKEGPSEVTLTQVLDDLRMADEVVRRFEWRYWLSSTTAPNLPALVEHCLHLAQPAQTPAE